jgi:hypothetical protein
MWYVSLKNFYCDRSVWRIFIVIGQFEEFVMRYKFKEFLMWYVSLKNFYCDKSVWKIFTMMGNFEEFVMRYKFKEFLDEYEYISSVL